MFKVPYFIEYSAHFFTLKMMLKHCTWQVAEKGFKMAFMLNKLAMINSCEISLEKYK